MALIFLIAIIDIWKKKYRPTFDILDAAIFLYIATLLVVSFFTDTSTTGFIYGLRYDGEFLIAFLFFRQIM